MNIFKYENAVLSKTVFVIFAVVEIFAVSYLLDYSKWQYYAVLFFAIGLTDLVSELLSKHNVFTKTGEYRIEDNSIYIKKSSGEKEIPMDMVDSITVSNDGIFSHHIMSVFSSANRFTACVRNRLIKNLTFPIQAYIL